MFLGRERWYNTGNSFITKNTIQHYQVPGITHPKPFRAAILERFFPFLELIVTYQNMKSKEKFTICKL
jgi:hypothetical protein